MPHFHIGRGQWWLQIFLHLLEHGRNLLHVLGVCRESLLERRIVAVNINADTNRTGIDHRVLCEESRITYEKQIATQRGRQVIAFESFNAFQVGVGICLGDHGIEPVTIRGDRLGAEVRHLSVVLMQTCIDCGFRVLTVILVDDGRNILCPGLLRFSNGLIRGLTAGRKC